MKRKASSERRTKEKPARKSQASANPEKVPIAPKKAGTGVESRSKVSGGPVRWDSLPHEELGALAEQRLKLDACNRSADVAAFYVAKRRLATGDPGIHSVYANFECARLVERLRAIRDVYREHLNARGCAPSTRCTGLCSVSE